MGFSPFFLVWLKILNILLGFALRSAQSLPRHGLTAHTVNINVKFTFTIFKMEELERYSQNWENELWMTVVCTLTSQGHQNNPSIGVNE